MNVKTTTKKKLSLLSLLWKGLEGGLLLFALAGCPGESPVDNPDDPNNPVNVVMQNMALTGTVKDVSGNPLSGVNVTTGTLNVTTGGDGTFSFTQAGTVNSRAVIKFEKNGYFTLTRSGNKADEMNVEVMMSPKGNSANSLQADLDASTAKTLQIGGIKIELPASCFAKSDGSAYSGTVRADVLNLGSGNANTALMIPGGDLATDKSDEMMLPIGMVDAVFTDNAGNLLKIKDNTNVRMTWPAPSGVTNLPSSIPLWTFDEARGIWLEEGSATLQGNVYTGTVSHFTQKGAGTRAKTAIMQIHATECDDKPAAGAQILFHDVTDDDALQPLYMENFMNGTYFTDSKGDCSVTVPKTWSDWTVNVSYKGQNQRQAFTQGNMGKQVVSFKFDNGCNGFDLTFNLKPGLSSNSFIIECVPAMPEPKKGYGFDERKTPDYFLGNGAVLRLDAFTFTRTSGSIFDGIAGVYEQWGWNKDFTQYTYMLTHSMIGSTWTGNVTMMNTDIFMAKNGQGQAIMNFLNIKSITIGQNTPVPLVISN